MPQSANRAANPRVCREHFNGRCMEKTEGSSPYCKQHKFEHYVRQRKLNRRAGLCKCGNKPIDGQSARGSVIQHARPVWLNSGRMTAQGWRKLRHCRMTFGGMQETGGMLAFVRWRYRYTG